MRNVLASAALAASLAYPMAALAQAPDADTATASGASSSDDGFAFRGIRIEGDVGWNRFSAEGQKPSKLGYGATVGFDGQYKRFVLGAEGSFWRANDGNHFCVHANTDVNCRTLFHEWGGAVRAGYLVTPQLLVFGKGGFAATSEDVYILKLNGAHSYKRFQVDGYQIGGGIEYSLPVRGLPVYITAQFVRSQYDHHNSRERALGGVGIRFK